MQQRIFIVEDEPKLAQLMAAHLQRYGFETVIAERLHDLRQEFLDSAVQLVLLDVNLPHYDGFYWCRQIRTVSTVPIIFVTARGADMDQVLAVEHGADDYLVKPFSLDVLTARIRAQLRRAYGEYSTEAAPEHGLRLDPLRLQVSWAGSTVSLTRNEALLLEALSAAAGRVVSRQRLLALLWDESEFVDDNTLTVNVTRLRRRLASLGLAGAIDTVRGEGYRLDLP